MLENINYVTSPRETFTEAQLEHLLDIVPVNWSVYKSVLRG